MKIVLSTVVAVFLLGCSSENKSEATQTAVQEEVKTVKEVKAPETKEAAVEKVEEVQAQPVAVKEPMKSEVPAPVAPKAEEVEKTVEEPKTVAPVAKTTIDGGALFGKCTACHGQNAEKAAMGKSQIIKGWSVDKIMTAFHGYKDGTYGGAMKGIMKSQISNYSEAELKALATHISKL